jgi:hypothetical protein
MLDLRMKVSTALTFCVSLIIIASYFTLIITNAVDIPNGDDLYCLLVFVQDFQDAQNPMERLQLLTGQWVEHRIFYSRFVALLSFWLTGQVNFLLISVLGNLSLIGFAIVFWKIIRHAGMSAYYFIPIMLILFSPVMYEGNLWSGASTVYMPVCFLGLLIVYLLCHPSDWSFVPAVAAGLLATFSFGNGMFSLITGVILLVYQRRFARAATWGLLSLIMILEYFKNFKVFSATNAFGFTEHFKHPEYLFYNLFAFIGGIFEYTENTNGTLLPDNIPAITAGFVLAISLSAIVYFELIKKNGIGIERSRFKIVWAGMVIFIGITAVAMAYSRTLDASMNTLASRYKIYSMVFLILFYLSGLLFFDFRRRFGIIFGTFTLCLLIFNYYCYYGKFSNYKSSLLAGLYNYNNNGQWIIYRHTAYYEKASLILTNSVKHHSKPVYHFQSVFPQLNLRSISQARTIGGISVKDGDGSGLKKDKWLTITSESYPSLQNFHNGIYIVIYDEHNIFLFAANPKTNGRISMVKNGSYFKNGFYWEENLLDLLHANKQYKIALFCPTEKEQIRRINYTISG